MSEINEELRNVLHAKERICADLASLAERSEVDVGDRLKFENYEFTKL